MILLDTNLLTPVELVVMAALYCDLQQRSA
jgi:hypothetical protein